MPVRFTSHNIDLGNGERTRSHLPLTIEQEEWFCATRRTLDVLFPGDRSNVSVVDLGCLEGGYSVGFARMGFQTLGIEVRQASFEACEYARSKVNLPNLRFVRDDAWNFGRYGDFDIVFCCGLLYHLDRPLDFLKLASTHCRSLFILNTHFSTETRNDAFPLSDLEWNEGLEGRWFIEYPDEKTFADRENRRWAAWDNRRSFWPRREWLLQAIRQVGFDTVMEQFDVHGENLVEAMQTGRYRKEDRGLFIGAKSGGFNRR